MDLTLKIINSIFPKVCKTGLEPLFMHGPLDMSYSWDMSRLSVVTTDDTYETLAYEAV